MTEERIWEQQPEEPLRWYRRFDRYRLMQPIHSIPRVYQEELEARPETARTRENPREKLPGGDWYEMADRWDWKARAAAWDAHVDAELEEAIKAERKKVLRSELALQHERIRLLNSKAQQLDQITGDDSKIWIANVRVVGSGKEAQVINLVEFNDAAFRELREYIKAIAEEMGERVKLTKQELSGSLETTNTHRAVFILPELEPDLDDVEKEGIDGDSNAAESSPPAG